MIKKFCYWQIKCEEDNENTWTCTQNMADGRVYECPYKSFEEAQKTKFKCVKIG
jgi:hypothetical protein